MKTKFPSAISLTKTQIEWLLQQPNGSELIGKLIDALMPYDKLTPETLQSVKLHTAYEHLNSQLALAQTKRRELLKENEWHFKHVQVCDDGTHTNQVLETPLAPIDSDGEIAMRVLADYDASIAALQTETKSVRDKLLCPTERDASLTHG